MFTETVQLPLFLGDNVISVPSYLNQQDARQLERQTKRCATKSLNKAVVGGIFGRFSNFSKCRSQVAGEVISGPAVDYVGMDVLATCGGSGLNSGRNI